MAGAWLAWRCNCPTIEHQKTLADGLWIEVILVSILVGEVSLKSTVFVFVGTPKHQCTQEFITGNLDSRQGLGICWQGGICDKAISGKCITLPEQRDTMKVLVRSIKKV